MRPLQNIVDDFVRRPDGPVLQWTIATARKVFALNDFPIFQFDIQEAPNINEKYLPLVAPGEKYGRIRVATREGSMPYLELIAKTRPWAVEMRDAVASFTMSGDWLILLEMVVKTLLDYLEPICGYHDLFDPTGKSKFSMVYAITKNIPNGRLGVSAFVSYGYWLDICFPQLYPTEVATPHATRLELVFPHRDSGGVQRIEEFGAIGYQNIFAFEPLNYGNDTLWCYGDLEHTAALEVMLQINMFDETRVNRAKYGLCVANGPHRHCNAMYTWWMTMSGIGKFRSIPVLVPQLRQIIAKVLVSTSRRDMLAIQPKKEQIEYLRSAGITSMGDIVSGRQKDAALVFDAPEMAGLSSMWINNSYRENIIGLEGYDDKLPSYEVVGDCVTLYDIPFYTIETLVPSTVTQQDAEVGVVKFEGTKGIKVLRPVDRDSYTSCLRNTLLRHIPVPRVPYAPPQQSYTEEQQYYVDLWRALETIGFDDFLLLQKEIVERIDLLVDQGYGRLFVPQLSPFSPLQVVAKATGCTVLTARPWVEMCFIDVPDLATHEEDMDYSDEDSDDDSDDDSDGSVRSSSAGPKISRCLRKQDLSLLTTPSVYGITPRRFNFFGALNTKLYAYIPLVGRLDMTSLASATKMEIQIREAKNKEDAADVPAYLAYCERPPTGNCVSYERAVEVMKEALPGRPFDALLVSWQREVQVEPVKVLVPV